MKTNGFSLIELMISIAIIGILTGIVSVSVQTLQAHARYSKTKADMDIIAQAAYVDYSTSKDNLWPLISYGTMPPSLAANNLLDSWPISACPGWYYSWEDWTPFGISARSVTVRKSDNTLLFSYCVNTIGVADCFPADPLGFGGTPMDISSNPINHIYCTE